MADSATLGSFSFTQGRKGTERKGHTFVPWLNSPHGVWFWPMSETEQQSPRMSSNLHGSPARPCADSPCSHWCLCFLSPLLAHTTRSTSGTDSPGAIHPRGKASISLTPSRLHWNHQNIKRIKIWAWPLFPTSFIILILTLVISLPLTQSKLFSSHSYWGRFKPLWLEQNSNQCYHTSHRVPRRLHTLLLNYEQYFASFSLNSLLWNI